jgi:uncharacterized protein VirK/YbjX
MSLLFQLMCTAGQVHPDPSFRDLLSRIKYVLRGLLTPRQTRKWFDILDQPKLAVVVRNHPHILSKLQRSYLDSTPGPWARLRALENHYRFVTSRLSAASVKQIYSSTGLLLVQIPLFEAGNLELRLRYHDSLSKEGDISISVDDVDNGGRVAALSFCLWQYNCSRSQIYVGGLQSFKQPNQKERVINITRAMHGLRPKALLFFTLQQLAVTWNIDSIRAVSDARHVYRHYRKRKNLAMSYDKFWVECGGQLNEDRLFTLPRIWVPRDLSRMNPSKRHMYRRRYALLQELALQIRESMRQSTLSPVDVVQLVTPLVPAPTH